MRGAKPTPRKSKSGGPDKVKVVIGYATCLYMVTTQTSAPWDMVMFMDMNITYNLQSQRSLSTLSFGPIPSPVDPGQEEKAQETFDKLYEKMKNNGEVASDEGKLSARH